MCVPYVWYLLTRAIITLKLKLSDDFPQNIALFPRIGTFKAPFTFILCNLAISRPKLQDYRLWLAEELYRNPCLRYTLWNKPKILFLKIGDKTNSLNRRHMDINIVDSTGCLCFLGHNKS